MEILFSKPTGTEHEWNQNGKWNETKNKFNLNSIMIWRPCFPFCSCSMFGVVVWRNWSKFRINQSSMKIPRKEAEQIDRNKKNSKSTQKNYFAKNVVVVISRSNRIWIINECGITLANTSKYHAIQNIAGGRWQKAKMCRNFVRRNLSYVEFTFHWLFSQRNTTYMRKVFRFLHVTFFFLYSKASLVFLFVKQLAVCFGY